MKYIDKINQYDFLIKLLENNDLLILSGCSGSGKSFLSDQMLIENNNFVKLRSTTTRKPRPQEEIKSDYIFVDKQTFDSLHHVKVIEFPQGSKNYYSYTIEELNLKLKSKKKIIVILAPAVIRFYQDFFNNNHIKFKSAYLTISDDELKNRYLNRIGLSSDSQLSNQLKKDLDKRLAEKHQDEQLLNYYDYVIDSSKKLNFSSKKK